MPQKTMYVGMPRLPYWKFQTVGTAPPTVVNDPYVSGSIHVGGTLNCTMGIWTNEPTSYAYQWLRDGTPIAGATTNSHLNVAADNGHELSCEVTATNALGNASAISNAVAVVTTAALAAEKGVEVKAVVIGKDKF